MSRPTQPTLHAITYLAPGLPLEFFERVTRALADALGREITLESDERSSGPMHGDRDPFAAGRADIGFLCSPSYLYLRSLPEPTVELVPTGFVFEDPRNEGRPVYFSDVIVRADRDAARLDDFATGVFGFNDTCSLSGYFAAKQELARRFDNTSFFEREVCTGSHAASIDAVLAGDIDLAAIDSNVLATLLRETPTLADGLRVLESWGPHPIQPVVVRVGLEPELANGIAAALQRLVDEADTADALRGLGLVGCAPIDDTVYADERAALEGLGELGPRCS